jgi:hypothetical protein
MALYCDLQLWGRWLSRHSPSRSGRMTIETVSREDLEEQLATVRALAPRGAEGVFGPASVTWQIDREAAIFLGAGRALLLQLAHPWVAAAIFEHARTFTDPIGRFHRTFEVVFSLVFGALDQAFAAARRLHRRHCVRINDPDPWPECRITQSCAGCDRHHTLSAWALSSILSPGQPAEGLATRDD